MYKKTKIKTLNRNKDKLKALNYKIEAQTTLQNYC